MSQEPLLDDKIKRFKEIIAQSEKIVFFGGAGVSTESGIPDFRSPDGLYNLKYDYPPEQILSDSFFYGNAKEFYRFYNDKIIGYTAKPNSAHVKLAEWELSKKNVAVVTQNIDGLHQAAGSKRVYELHGSVHRNHCLSCNKFYDLAALIAARDAQGVPRCSCGGIIKPDVVLYGEGLDEKTVSGAIKSLSEADALIIGGTSLTVYPASSFIRYFGGRYIVVVNKGELSTTLRADLIIKEPIGKVFALL